MLSLVKQSRRVARRGEITPSGTYSHCFSPGRLPSSHIAMCLQSLSKGTRLISTVSDSQVFRCHSRR